MRKKYYYIRVYSCYCFFIGAGMVYYFYSQSARGYHKDGSKVFYKVYGISNSEVIGAMLNRLKQ